MAGIGSIGYGYNPYMNYGGFSAAGSEGTSKAAAANGYVPGKTDLYGNPLIETPKDKALEESPIEKRAKIRAGQEKCETCAKRKYKDGSDEMVSFKSAAHISPESAPARVRAHEQEHVSNAYKDAAKNNGKVLQASVAIHTAVCPECGRNYVSGGTTYTRIKYTNESNPYQQNRKSADGASLTGINFDHAV
ncbi:MAG: hypothetical protein K6D96_08055 [Acetatifactor sp.]|nr:hypothetical protein [Acetatifactor sp.]